MKLNEMKREGRLRREEHNFPHDFMFEQLMRSERIGTAQLRHSKSIYAQSIRLTNLAQAN